MRFYTFTIVLFISLLNYAVSVDIFNITHMGQPAFQFEVTDGAYMPAYYADGAGMYPSEGWSYFWQTDEGAISHEKQPIFFFNMEGMHTVSLVLVPRKKEDDVGTVTSTFMVDVLFTEISSNFNTDIQNDPIYFLNPPNVGDKAFVVVPLNSCQFPTIQHQHSVGYNNSQLQFVEVLGVDNISGISDALEDDYAMGYPTNKKVKFTMNWTSIRPDVAAVLVFDVVANPGSPVAVKHTPETKLQEPCKPSTEALEFSFVGPYDPNYKESNVNEINVAVVDSSKTDSTSVEYTIHFQNIGNGPVDSVTIVDSLPDYLEFVSHVGSSAPSAKVNYTVTGKVVTWVLSPDLDVRGTNESPGQSEYKTKGWVKFSAKISPEDSIVYDTCYCLCNRATIYFDDLAPITTKADIIAIGDRLCFSRIGGNDRNGTYADKMCYDSTNFYGKPSTSSTAWGTSINSKIRAYPNPTSGMVVLEGDFKGKINVAVHNAIGVLVYEIKSDTYQLDFSNLPQGNYTVTIDSDKKRYFAKVIKF